MIEMVIIFPNNGGKESCSLEIFTCDLLEFVDTLVQG